ncbi:hypothetical protein TIFTF001_042746 [Ficus carica]|uniref:CCHC-type domain-containing protein n=1 Tax=Ficus carica TaxID=3494 RepID=A0AA87ZJ93_FICCA|nr:hypothetical protein TIFTF001_042746 [Ficus carica]
MPVNLPESDLAIVVVNLQRQLLEQQRETDRLQKQIARSNQILQDKLVTSQGNPPLTREDSLHKRFKRMKAPEFEGTATSIEVDNWLTDIQVILDFMGLTEQEKVLCASFVLKKDAQHWWMTVQMHRNVTTMSWQDFMIEFRAMYFNREILTTQQNEFNSFRQGSMTVLEAVKKFEQLARLCPELVPNETEKAIRAEYRINQDKEARIQILKAKKENKDATKQLQPRQNLKLHSKGQTSNSAQKKKFKQLGKNKKRKNATSQGQQGNYPQKKTNRGDGGNNNSKSYPVCAQCGRKRIGVCKFGMNICYLCDKEGHYARNCTLKNQNPNPQFPNRDSDHQLLVVQAKKLKAFRSHKKDWRLRNHRPGIMPTQRRTLKLKLHRWQQLGKILLSDYWIRSVPIINCDRKFYMDLVVIKLQDLCAILRMEFLGKDNAKMDCRKRGVISSPLG